MLSVHQLTKFYDLQPVLQNVTFTVNAGERVGLIGANGSGKSTLLRLIMGELQADSGHVTLTPPSLRVGYLSQGFACDPKLTLAQILHRTAPDPAQLEAELEELAVALAADPTRDDLQTRYDAVLQQLSETTDNGRLQRILAAFELDGIDATQSVDILSGGQKTRLALALLLLQSPQLLLLDEPTNHLDIEMLEWLEQWLLAFSGGVLLVSHDRTFLDHTVTRILDLDPHTQMVQEYVGNYSDYLAQYLQVREKQWSQYKDQVYEIRRMRQDIQRTAEQARHVERTTKPNQPNVRRLAKKVAKKAKARAKKLERYLESEDRVEKPARSWQMKLEVEGAAHLGRDVLIMDSLTIGYAGRAPLLRDITRSLRAGQRVVLTGRNGAGKTTLLRTIAGQKRPLAGSLRLGSTVQLGYMAQEQEHLDPNETPLRSLRQVAAMNQTDARSFLHYFLFTGEDALRPNHLLSYGERARLRLALLVAGGCNFLLLDEPINHLDIPSRTQFEQALLQFEGTILAVIHDRYFIERFATEVWTVQGDGLQVQLLEAV